MSIFNVQSSGNIHTVMCGKTKVQECGTKKEARNLCAKLKREHNNNNKYQSIANYARHLSQGK